MSRSINLHVTVFRVHLSFLHFIFFGRALKHSDKILKMFSILTVEYPLFPGQKNLNIIAFFVVFDFQVTPSGRFSDFGSQGLNNNNTRIPTYQLIHIIWSICLITISVRLSQLKYHVLWSITVKNNDLKRTVDRMLASFACSTSLSFHCTLFQINSVLHRFRSRLRHEKPIISYLGK